MKLLKVVSAIILVLTILIVFYINNFIVLGTYSSRNAVNEKGVIERIYLVKTTAGTDVKGITYSKIFLGRQGFLSSVINLPKEELGKFISSVRFRHTVQYPYKSDSLRSSGEIDYEKEPYLMAELNDESAGFELRYFPTEYKNNDSVDFVIKSELKSIAIIVCKEKDGRVKIFLYRQAEVSDITSIRNGLSLRKWF